MDSGGFFVFLERVLLFNFVAGGVFKSLRI